MATGQKPAEAPVPFMETERDGPAEAPQVNNTLEITEVELPLPLMETEEEPADVAQADPGPSAPRHVSSGLSLEQEREAEVETVVPPCPSSSLTKTSAVEMVVSVPASVVVSRPVDPHKRQDPQNVTVSSPTVCSSSSNSTKIRKPEKLIKTLHKLKQHHKREMR